MASAKKRRIVNIITVTAVFGLLFAMTWLCPLLSDDYHFHYVFESINMSPHENRLDSFSEVITSTRNYYSYSGGRVVSHFLLFLMFSVSDSIYLVLNPLMFTLLGYIAYRVAVKDKNADRMPALLPLTYLAMLFMLPRFGDDVLWRAGSVNYMWTSVLLLGCLILIDKYFERPTLKRSLPVSLIAFVTATCNEVNGGLILVFMAAWLFPFFLGGTIKKYKYSAVIALFVVLGSAFLLSAPGNSVRISEDIGAGVSTPGRFFVLFGSYLWIIVRNIGWLMPFLIIKIVKVDVKKCGKRFTGCIHSNRYFISGCAGVLALSLESRKFPRASFTGIMIALVGLLSAAAALYDYAAENGALSEKSKRVTDGVCIGVIALFTGITLWNVNLMRGDRRRLQDWQNRAYWGYIGGSADWWHPEFDMKTDRRSFFSAYDSLHTTTHNQHFVGWQMLYLKDINLYHEIYEVIDVVFFHLSPPAQRSSQDPALQERGTQADNSSSTGSGELYS